MTLRSSTLRSCARFVAAALALGASSSLTGCAPGEEMSDLETVVQGVTINVAPGESIAAAVNRANPGDRVMVPAGTYAGGGWIQRSGTATAPITVVSADGPRRAVIQGGGESLRVGGSAYLVFDGFEVRNSGDNTVHIDSSHHITLRNLYAHDAGTNGDVLKVNQSHHMTIERSEFARPGRRTIVENPYQECLDFVDVDDSVIRDNFIHDGGSMLMFVKGGSRNTVIERNVLSEQRAGASDPMVGLGGPTDIELLQGEQFEVINVVLRNNVIVGGVTGAVAVYDAQGAYIANNLLLNNDRVLIEFRAGNGPAGRSENVRVVNNLMVDTRGRMPTPLRLSSHGLTGLQTSYNTWWNNGAALPTTALLSLTAQAGHLATNPMVGVPAASATRDVILSTVRPASGSPAAASGTDASASPFGVTDDVNSVARGTQRDRGPFMLGAAAPAPTPTSPTPTSPTPTSPTPTPTPTPTPAPSGATVSYAVTTPGAIGRATTLTARSTGLSSPEYRFAVRNPNGSWSRPCGSYDAESTCSFMPNIAGTWTIRVWARDASSTAAYDAAAVDAAYTVAASGVAMCPHEATSTDFRGEPRNAAGFIRYCWPGEASCYCDQDDDCYAQPGYAGCR